jgi:type I restriction enzyme R subunit
MNASFTESVIEQAALAWIEELGYDVLSGPDIAPGKPGAERDNYGSVFLEARLRQALQRLNPQVPADALDEVTRPDSPSLVAGNRVFHKYLVEGVPVEYQRKDGSIGGDLVRVLDYDNPENNEFLAVNQFTVVEDGHERRPDIVLFVNGLPLAVIELKNATAESATIWSAFNQLQTYKQQIPSLFVFNEALVISDGMQARIGTLTANRESFMPWRTIAGEELADDRLPQLQVVLEGVFDKRRLLNLIRHFIVFEDAADGVLVKKMAGYHQFHAVNVAVEETLRACVAGQDDWQVAEGQGTYSARRRTDAQAGDRRVGVIWHTQGSDVASRVLRGGGELGEPKIRCRTLPTRICTTCGQNS